MSDRSDYIILPVMMLSIFGFSYISSFLPHPFNLIFLGTSFAPMIVAMKAQEWYEELKTSRRDGIRATISPHQSHGDFNLFFINTQTGPFSKIVGTGYWTMRNGRTVEVLKYCTKILLAPEFRLKHYPGYPTVRQFDITHLLPFNLRMSFGDGKMEHNGIKVSHTHCATASFRESERAHMDDDLRPYPHLILKRAQGDDYLEDHPEVVYAESEKVLKARIAGPESAAIVGEQPAGGRGNHNEP